MNDETVDVLIGLGVMSCIFFPPMFPIAIYVWYKWHTRAEAEAYEQEYEQACEREYEEDEREFEKLFDISDDDIAQTRQLPPELVSSGIPRIRRGPLQRPL